MNVPVLLYHSVAPTADRRFAQWTVPPEQFAAQMDLLAREGYRALTVTELAQRLWDRPERVPERVVAITFDDAFADFHANAWPHLRRNGLSATVFVTTAYVGLSSVWLAHAGEGDRALMGWPQLAEIAAAGIELGAHSHRHVQLDTVSRARARAEIELSGRALRDATGPVASFAYPHGYHTRAVRREVRRAGFTSACAVGDAMASPADDRYAISRAIVRPGIALDAFVEMLEGRHGNSRRRPLRRAAWRAIRRAGWEPGVDRLRTSLGPRLSG